MSPIKGKKEDARASIGCSGWGNVNPNRTVNNKHPRNNLHTKTNYEESIEQPHGPRQDTKDTHLLCKSRHDTSHHDPGMHLHKRNCGHGRLHKSHIIKARTTSFQHSIKLSVYPRFRRDNGNQRGNIWNGTHVHFKPQPSPTRFSTHHIVRHRYKLELKPI